MAECIWVQYEPEGSASPYPGFINATVTGDTEAEPPLAPPRLQLCLPLGMAVDGMRVDVAHGVLVPDEDG